MNFPPARLKWPGRWLRTCAAVLASAGAAAPAQQPPIGSVSTLDATVTGAALVADGRAQLATGSTVVAKDRVAEVLLARGGTVRICATSGLHLTAGAPAADAPTASPLMVALDRGAIELRTAAVPGDIVMTPDLRFSFNGSGPLDLRVRVTRNGDTCVENRVAGNTLHPQLQAGSLFGGETYTVMPGQHVLFEGGSLREVVDNETSPCGCPEPPAKRPGPEDGTVALNTATNSSTTMAEERHPFPADVSQGLAPPPPVPQAPPGVTHTQVAATLVYDPPPAGSEPKDGAQVKPSPPPEKAGFFHSLGRFFKRIL